MDCWNQADKLSPARSPSVNSNTNSLRKEDYNQNYCDRLSAGNSPMTPVNEFNGNLPPGIVDPRYQIPLQIEVGPVSTNIYFKLDLYKSFINFDTLIESRKMSLRSLIDYLY